MPSRPTRTSPSSTCSRALGAGFDIVSGGELARVLAAGGDPAKVVFSGVGKTTEEMRRRWQPAFSASTSSPPRSWPRSTTWPAAVGKNAPIAIRVNPDVNPKTHPYISTGLRSNKFGVAYERGARAVSPRPRPAACRHRRHRLPHRLATARPGACRRGRRPTARPSPIAWPPRASPLRTRPRRRHRHPLPRRNAARHRRLPRADPGAAGGAQGKDPVRAGPRAGRQRRPPAHPHRVPEARRGKELRHRRCGHERPDAAGALRCLARHPAGAAARRRHAAETTRSSARSASRATSSDMTAVLRSNAGRPAGHPLRRRLRHGHELELQHPSACRRGDRGRRAGLPRPSHGNSTEQLFALRNGH